MLPNATTDHVAINSASYIWKWHGAEVIFLCLMLVFAILGNMLVIYIYHFRWRRSNFSLFIEVLAVLDLTNASITIPLFLVITLNDRHPKFAALCQTSSFVAITTVIASAVVLVVIAFDRNRNICNPLKKKISVKAARIYCFLAVCLGIVVSIPGIFVNGRRELMFEDNGMRINITQCYFTEEFDGTALFWVFMSILSMVFLAVMVILAVLYVSIYRALKIHTARRPSTTICEKKNRMFRSHKTSAKIFFAVTVAFFCSYFPYFIAVIVFLFDGQLNVLSPGVKAVADIAKLSPLMSNAVNPLIYSVSSKRFRKEVFDVFRCRAFKQTRSERDRTMVQGTASSTADADT
ncbi:neuropeptide S receptor-like [Haliotis asinina]|uniref:neuropeptide S receptor-like n=1 Tax=Haliotis asinina TaxID=109174 RepID=UPI0035320060